MKLNWIHFKLKNGGYVLNTYIQNEDMQEFFKIWNIKKKEIKENNFSLTKYNEKWQLSYWNKDYNLDIENIYSKCNELCKKLGFIKINYFNKLSFELKQKIFSYIRFYELYLLRIVCKEFKYIKNNIPSNICLKTYDYNHYIDGYSGYEKKK